MEINELLDNIKHITYKDIDNDIKKLNKILLPINILTMENYNILIKYLHEQEAKGLIKRHMDRTNSGGISIKHVYNILNSYELDLKTSAKGTITGAAIIVLMHKNFDLFAFRAVLGNENNFEFSKSKKDSTKLRGTEAYKTFKKVLKQFNVDIENEKYAINNGKEVKKEIPAPMINCFVQTGEKWIYEHAYHLDINSSFPSAMAELFPEWKPAIEYMYNMRKTEKKYKLVLNASYGYFQSKFCKINKHGYALAHVSKFCLERNNEKITKMMLKMQELGCMILSTNTDGFFFIPPEDENRTEWKQIVDNTNKELGNFKCDHKDVKIRFKSRGSYEFIENGEYNAVVRGETRLDRIEPDRTKWSWGDIFRQDCEILKYHINTIDNDEYGFVTLTHPEIDFNFLTEEK